MPDIAVLRLRPSRVALIAVFFLLVCVTPVAFVRAWLLVLYVVPVLALLWILRTGTDIDPEGVTVRAVAGSRRLPWEQVSGLSPGPRGDLLLVLADGGLIRLPSARLRHLDLISAASGGTVPAVSQ